MVLESERRYKKATEPDSGIDAAEEIIEIDDGEPV
jgi:hypothetical protein